MLRVALPQTLKYTCEYVIFGEFSLVVFMISMKIVSAESDSDESNNMAYQDKVRKNIALSSSYAKWAISSYSLRSQQEYLRFEHLIL